MELRPSFYDGFACLADRCRHSCCRGWEIDVDDASAERYRALPGPLGELLRERLRRAEDVWSFTLTERGDCPLLRPDGLCRLILELGEDALCDVCALHPRFFFDVGGHELAGVSAGCEAAAALLLGERGPLTFLTETDEPLTLPALLRLLGQEVPEADLRFTPTADAARCRAILRRYAACEPIDAAWTEALARLDAADLPHLAAEHAERYDRAGYDRILGYLLYRQLERLPAYGLAPLLRFAWEAAEFLFLWDALEGDAAERLRAWCAEMEYSTENTDLLLDGLR